jgi:AraC-like DNA-binding protein
MGRLTLDWLHVIALLGAIQGVFLAGVLATKRSNRTPNRLLAATMVAFSIYLATAVYHAGGFERVFPHFFGAAHPMPFLFGPLIYLYAVTVADRDRRLTWRDTLHFAPFVVTVIVGLPIYTMSGAEKIALYQQMQTGEIPLQIVIAAQLKLISGVIYATMTIAFLRRHRDRVKESYSSLERVNLTWLLWLGAAAAAIWLMAVVFQLTESAGVMRIGRGDDLISLAIAVLVYGIGYMGLRQPEIFRYETAEYRVPAEARAERRAEARAVERPPPREEAVNAEPEPLEPRGSARLHVMGPETDTPRYERSGLTDREAEQLKDALMTAMDRDRPWRDSDLTLADLADRLSTTPHKLSEVLNSQVGQTFYDFVNGYRVREVQRRIAAGDAKRLTMLALALDAGFASKSTFNMVFKKHTRQTPSDYRQAAGM